MLIQPTEEMQNETVELRQGKVQMTLRGWQMLDTKITELHKAGNGYSFIADKMDISQNTLRKLRREKEVYRTNYADLEGIFNIFNVGKTPRKILPEEHKHYEYVLRPPTPAEPKFALPYEPQCFQGREQDLQQIRERFQQGKHKQAIIALGGMGKTYLALEYARRYWNEYKHVFWVQADTEESVGNRYVEFARLLGLMKKPAPAQNQAIPLTEEKAREQKQAEQTAAIAAFLKWIDTHNGWLLVLDNADDPEFLHNYLPADPQGDILLTTRAHDLSDLHFYNPLELETLSPTASLQFFLHRCNRHNATSDEHQAAAELAADLDYLPLALAHAAAYIARRQTGFAHYRELYEEQKLALMDNADTDEDNGGLISIRATWELSFQALEHDTGAGRAGAYARDLLNICAFLGAENISCDLVLSGTKEYCPPLHTLLPHPQRDSGQRAFGGAREEAVFHDLLLPLIRYSLVTKNLASPPRFNIHRMVQLVIADRLGDQKREWQERALRVVDRAFPAPETANWQACERLLPHAIAVADMVRQAELATREAGRLLCYLGEFLMIQGCYEQAALYALYALNVRETLAVEHPLDPQYLLDLAVSLHCLSSIYHHQRKLEEAQALLERVLAIRSQHSAEDTPETLRIHNDLAALYNSLQLYPQAESIYLELLARAEAIRADGASVTTPDQKAILHHNLGNSCYWQQRFEEAVRWYNTALAHWEAYGVSNHPGIADTWHDLAKAYRRLNHTDAEECYKKALRIQQAAHPQGHPRTAVTLYNLADFYKETCRYPQSEEYFLLTRDMDIKLVGEIHADIIFDLNALADLYRRMERPEDANATQQQAEAIARKLAEREQQG